MLRHLFKRLSLSRSVADGYARGSQHYSGSYHGGKARFYFDQRDGRRVYHGLFAFKTRYYKHPIGKIKSTARGVFVDGARDGRWEFTRVDRDTNQKLVVNYSLGKHEGDYFYRSEPQSKFSKRYSSFVSLSVTMRGGRPFGVIEWCSDNETLSGSYDEEGKPHGRWKLESPPGRAKETEHEVWEHGLLVEKYCYDHTQKIRIESRTRLFDFIRSFVYGECMPLETLTDKGAKAWTGDVPTDEKPLSNQ